MLMSEVLEVKIVQAYASILSVSYLTRCMRAFRWFHEQMGNIKKHVDLLIKHSKEGQSTHQRLEIHHA